MTSHVNRREMVDGAALTTSSFGLIQKSEPRICLNNPTQTSSINAETVQVQSVLVEIIMGFLYNHGVATDMQPRGWIGTHPR